MARSTEKVRSASLAPSSEVHDRWRTTPPAAPSPQQCTSRSVRVRNSRARNSTWTPAPPYTSGGYSRVSSPTRTQSPPVVPDTGWCLSWSPRRDARGRPRCSAAARSPATRPARRAVEAAVAAEAAAGEPVVEAAAAATQGTGVDGRGQVGMREQVGGEEAGPIGHVRTAVGLGPAVQLAPGTRERRARVPPQQALRHAVSGAQSRRQRGEVSGTTWPSIAATGRARTSDSHRSSGALPSGSHLGSPGRGPAAARTARRHRARPTTDGPRGPAGPPRPRSGARAPAERPRLSGPENSEDPTEHLGSSSRETRTPVRASAAGHAAVRRCVVREAAERAERREFRIEFHEQQ